MNECGALHAMSDVESESEVIVVQPTIDPDPELDIPQVKASGFLADFFKEQLV